MISVAVLTVSDSVVAGQRDDKSGPAVAARAQELGWSVAVTKVLADNPQEISHQLRQWADEGSASLILTTGGTGIAPRDRTPEATGSILEQVLPGVAELMRAEGRKQTPLSDLSRATAGVRRRSLIVNLPGSPRGAVFSLNTIAHLVQHTVDLLNGRTEHKGDENETS